MAMNLLIKKMAIATGLALLASLGILYKMNRDKQHKESFLTSIDNFSTLR
jgi:hypothetical protein